MFYKYYGPDYELDVRPSNMDNANTAEYLEKIKNQVIENIRRTMNNPSVQMTDVPRDPEGLDDEADAVLDDLDEDENPDTRYTQRRWDKYTEKEGELSESEDEEGNERNGVQKTRPARRRMNLLDYPNTHAAPDDEAELVHVLQTTKDTPDVATNGTMEHATSDTNSPPQKSSPPADDDNAEENMEENTEENAEEHTSGDIEMAEDVAEPQAPVQQLTPGPQEATPPASPPNEPAPAEAPAAEEDQPMAEAEVDASTRVEGTEEREKENAIAEESTELASKSEET